jgi:hypothetical protein
MDASGRSRGVTPVIGNVLLVAVIIVIGFVLATFAFTFLDGLGAPTADAAFEYEQTPAGLELTPKALGTDVIVKLNGQTVTTFDADAAGQSALLPTAPDDRIVIVSEDEDKSVFISEEIDERSEIGDFIAYYSFDQESCDSDTVVDQSGNGNDGDPKNGYSCGSDGAGSYMQFDGNSGTHVDMGNLKLTGPDEVDEITIAIKYRKNFGTSGCSGVNCIQNLIEHQDGSFAWFMETNRNYPSDPHRMQFNVGYNGPNGGAEVITGDIPEQEVQILVGTFDGSELVLYRNGNRVGSKTLDREVQLGSVIVAADSGPSIQNFKGRIYELRLYYTAFSEDEAKVLTETMRNG